MKRHIVFLITVFALFFLILSCSTNKTQNIILIIGDGIGFNQQIAGSLYLYGQDSALVSQQFPVQLAMSTFSATGHGYDSEKAWNDFDYVKEKATDSAASATAISTGTKSYNGAIGVDEDKQPLTHFMEIAEDRGMATGVVTSVQFSHATPAGMIAHNQKRHNYHQIAYEMLMESRTDVIMGCGHPFYDNDSQRQNEPEFKYLSEELWNALNNQETGADADGDGQPDAWTIIQDRSTFQNHANGYTPKRVFGLVPVASTLQVNRSGEEEEPFGTPLLDSVPTLEEMAATALNILDDDPDGFVLMIEAGAIDWACHDNNGPRMIETVVGLEKTVQRVVEWVEQQSSWDKTLVIVTADHETGYLTGAGSNDGHAVWHALANNGKGVMPGFEWHSGGHTNQLVPFQAKGANAQTFIEIADKKDHIHGAYLDNTDIGNQIKALLQN